MLLVYIQNNNFIIIEACKQKKKSKKLGRRSQEANRPSFSER